MLRAIGESPCNAFAWPSRENPLPFELAIHILSFLPIKTIVAISLVSKSWRIVSEDPVLLTKTCCNEVTDLFEDADDQKWALQEWELVKKALFINADCFENQILILKQHLPKFIRFLKQYVSYFGYCNNKITSNNNARSPQTSSIVFKKQQFIKSLQSHQIVSLTSIVTQSVLATFSEYRSNAFKELQRMYPILILVFIYLKKGNLAVKYLFDFYSASTESFCDLHHNTVNLDAKIEELRGVLLSENFTNEEIEGLLSLYRDQAIIRLKENSLD